MGGWDEETELWKWAEGFEWSTMKSIDVGRGYVLNMANWTVVYKLGLWRRLVDGLRLRVFCLLLITMLRSRVLSTTELRGVNKTGKACGDG